jgi:drug/metabolite transporter (DMT)-like permease
MRDSGTADSVIAAAKDAKPHTLLGMLAVVLWGSNVAFSRSVAEHVDPLAVAGLMNAIAGVLACLPLVWRRESRQAIAELPLLRWLILGACFVPYMACLYLALGLSVDRQQALGVGLINYLWPSLTLLLSVPILGCRARWGLLPGIAMAAVGVVLANGGAGAFSFDAFLKHWRTAPSPYLLALAAAILWALYSNLTKRLAGSSRANPVPVLLLASGVLLGAVRAALPECVPYAHRWDWSMRTAGELAYLAVFPTWVAYQFWDLAMRRGRAMVVASFSYLTPLLSVLIYVAYLHVATGPVLWLGCALVIAGAVICRYSIDEPG